MTLELVPWRGAKVPVLNGSVSRATTMDYLNWLTSMQAYQGPPPVLTTYGSRAAEPISYSFAGFVEGMLYADGPVAAVEAYRLRVFGQAPLLYQEMVDGHAGDFYDDDILDRLREPWPGGNLSDLAKRALIHGDFAGNAFVADLEDELVLLRPDWVEIVLAKREYRGGQVGWKQLGIVYYEGGLRSNVGVTFLPGEYAHFVPGLPDPLATYRGMSWLTPLVREVQADVAASQHKLAWFENSASPNLAVSLPKEITPAQFAEFVERMDSQHKGSVNVGRTLYTAGGADVTVIGANMQQADFSGVVGKGETRVANAGGVPPTLLSFSEGMQGSSLNSGNYTAAKRNFVDTTMRDLWGNWAASLQKMDAFRPPRPKSRLWYLGKDIPFMHEDAQDIATIQQAQAATIASLVSAGFKPETIVQAVAHDDVTLLEHTGLTSVQLQPPATADANGDGMPDAQAQAADEYQQALDEFRAEVEAAEDEIERRFRPDQLRGPDGRWIDEAVIVHKTLKLGGQEIGVSVHPDKTRTLHFPGGRSVRLQPHEMGGSWRRLGGGARGGASSLRDLSFDAVDYAPGEGDSIGRIRETAAGNPYKELLLAVKKVAEPPDLHPNGDPGEETWDLTPVSIHLPPNDDAGHDELMSSPPVATMRQRDLTRLAELHIPAARVQSGTGAVDVFRDGGKFTVRRVGEPGITVDRKGIKALDQAINDLWDDDGRATRPDTETVERVVPTNAGDVTIRMTGEGRRTQIVGPGLTLEVDAAHLSDFMSALGDLVDSSVAARARAMQPGEIERRDYYDVRDYRGRFRKISDQIGHALNEWLKGNGDEHDPLKPFTQGTPATVKQRLRTAAKELGVDVPPRASVDQLKLALLTDARARFRDHADQPNRSASFTLKGGGGGPVAAPRRFDDADRAKAFLSEQYGPWREHLTPAQEKALALYQSPAFAVMNGRLRGLDAGEIKADVDVTPALVERSERATRDLRAAIAAAPPLSEPLVVHRSFGADQFGELHPGRVVTDEGFVSTSLTEMDGGGGIAGRGRPAIATITLPTGTRAAAGSYRELVLAPGSKFRVTSVKQRGRTTHLEMELVLPEGKSPLRDLDVGVYVGARTGKVQLLREHNGRPGTAVATFDDLAGLQAWADQHGEAELAQWARTEQHGTPAKVPAAKKAAPPKKATPNLDQSLVPLDLQNEDAFVAAVGQDAYDAVRRYAGPMFGRIQDDARAGGADAGIDRALAASRLTRDVEVYRGGSWRTLERDVGRSLSHDESLTGLTFTQRPYLSTSTEEDRGRGFANKRDGGFFMTIRVPEGTGGIVLSQGEAELLLERGLTLRVVQDHGWEDFGRFRHRHLDVEIVPAKKAAKKATPRTPAPEQAPKATVPTTRPATPPTPDLATLPTEDRRDALDLLKVGDVNDPNSLKGMLKARGLPVSGRKRDLVDRLVGHLDGGGAGPKGEAASPAIPDESSAQDAVPVQWSYGARAITAGGDRIPDQDRSATDAALKDWVYDKEPGRLGPDGRRESNAEPGVNAALRGTAEMTPRRSRVVELLDRALERSRTTRDATVYRGFADGSAILPADWQTRDLTGLTWDNPAYTSVTQSRDGAETYAGDPADRGFAIRIRLPEGSPAIAVRDDPGGLDDEGEIVLPRGLAYRVVADHGIQGDYGVRWLDVEVVPQSPPRPATKYERRPGVEYATRTTRLADTVTGEPDSVRPLGGGSSRVRRLTYGDTDVVHKDQRRMNDGEAKTYTDAEELGALVLDAVGVSSPATHRDGPDQIYLEWMPGTIGAEVTHGASPGPDIIDSRDGRLMGLADALMVNSDRGPANWLQTDTGLTGIDHGLAFLMSTPEAAFVNPFSRHFVTERPSSDLPDEWAATNDMHPDDMARIRVRLQGLRTKFEALDRLRWWEEMMARFDILAAAASGTERRL